MNRSSKTSRPPPAPRRALRFVLGAAGLWLLAAHLAYFTWHTDRAAQSFNRSAVPSDTIEGVPEPRFFTENDSYAWLSLVRDMMNAGEWRTRHTFMDNAPYGREVHWSHLLIWTLRGMAGAIAAVRGWPVARAVELAGVWVMPLFQFLLLSLAFLALLRKWGFLPAAGTVFVFLTFECVAISFFPLEPDHHGLHFLFVLAAFVCLQFGGLGWTRPAGRAAGRTAPFLNAPELPGPSEARRWFIASGVFGGLALWVGATVWIGALAVLALSMLPALPLFHPPRKDETYVPSLWRSWAAAGCLVAVLCYLLEYAPRHFSMRLEVNHPLYWISWAGVAWGLERAAELRRPLSWAAIPRLLLPGLLALALPLAVFLGPSSWHQMNDPLLQRLHAGYITEFLPSVLVREGDVSTFLGTFRLYLLALPLAGVLLFLRRLRNPHVHRLTASTSLAAILFLAVALYQQRWGYALAGTLVWLSLLLFVWLFSPGGGGRAVLPRVLGGSFLALILLDGAHSDLSRLRMENDVATCAAIPQSWIEYNLKKRNALQWGLAAGTNQWRFVGMAPQAPLLYYYAGIPSVASYYWENAAGWQAEALLMADTSPGAEQAESIARERGLTHVVTVLRSGYPKLYQHVATGNDNPSFAVQHTLNGHLTYDPVRRPPWIAPDEALTEIGQRDYVFKTPAGYAKEKLQYQVYSIQLPPDAPPPSP